MICDQYPPSSPSSQDLCRRGRWCQCLLKGCERWFWPTRPQSRYCSAGCRQQARRWRRWQASRRWRASERGRVSRRQQGQRYRQRRRQAQAAEAAAQATSPPEPPAPEVMPAAAQEPHPSVGREGQRPAIFCDDFPVHPCHRPGCYALFPLSARSPGQRFCCAQCRRALRRVLDREAKWRRRQRRRCGPSRWRGRAPPGAC